MSTPNQPNDARLLVRKEACALAHVERRTGAHHHHHLFSLIRVLSRRGDRFTPKEDIAGNAPMKSSLQRQIRSKILDQYPFLSQPASLPVLAQSGTGSVDDHHSDDEDDNNNEDLSSSRRRKGAGKDKKSKKEAGGGKKSGGNNNNSGGKKGQQQAEQVEDATAEDKPTDEEVLTVMDTLWPKKEGCSLVKWLVALSLSLFRRFFSPLFYRRGHLSTVETTSRCTRCTESLCFSNISTVRFIRL